MRLARPRVRLDIGVYVKNLRSNLKAVPLIGLALFLLASGNAFAQDAPTTGSTGQTAGDLKPAGRIGIAGVIQDSGSTDPSVGNTAPPPIEALGGGGWLQDVSPLHWGSLYISSFNFSEGYDDFSGGSPGSLKGVVHSSVFGTSVVFNPRFSRANLAFQWQPQAGVVNGRFADNLNNQNVSLDFTTLATPRLSVRFQDRFSYLPTQNVFAEGFLYAPQSIDNHSVQGAFLDGPGVWLTNAATLSLAYGLSPTTTVTVTPNFNYAHAIKNSSAASGGVVQSQLSLIGSKQYGSTVSLSHLLSPMKSVGLFYTASAVKFDNTPSFVWYHGIGATYSQQLRPSWFVNLSAGATTSSFGRGTNSWSFSGSADVEKHFQNSSATLAYSRGLSLSQYAFGNFTDRVDLRYTTNLTRKTTATMGFGYQHVGGIAGISGKYTQGQLGYQFLRNLSLMMTYVYRDQVGDAIQVYTETRHSAFVTLQWDPFHMR